MKSIKFLLIGLLAISFAMVLPISADAKSRDVVFCFAWVAYGKHVGFYAAQGKGFYKKEGLNVKMIRGVSGMDNAKRTSTGTCGRSRIRSAPLSGRATRRRRSTRP